MIYKTLSGTSLQWSINLTETRYMRIHCSVSVLIRYANGEEMHIIIDSLTHLVDLLIREFDDGLNLIGTPPLAFNRAFKSIADSLGIFDEREFINNLKYSYFKFLAETGLTAPFGAITPRGFKELYDQSMNLKTDLQGRTTADELRILEEAIEILDNHLKLLETQY